MLGIPKTAHKSRACFKPCPSLQPPCHRVSVASFVFIRSQQTHAVISRKPDFFCPFLVQSSLVHRAVLNGCKHMGWLFLSAQNNRDIFQTEIRAWISVSRDSPPSFQQLRERVPPLLSFHINAGVFPKPWSTALH